VDQLTSPSYTNPVISCNNPDPGVLRLPDGSGYAAVATSNFALRSRGDPAFPLYHSADLVTWSPRGHVFPAGAWPVWAEENMWAPEIHVVNGRFVVYFTGGHCGHCDSAVVPPIP
jgi:beta-xylosidase